MSKNTNCPTCNNPINHKTLIDVKRNHVRFLCECWSGNIHESAKKTHFWVMRVRLGKIKNFESDYGVKS